MPAEYTPLDGKFGPSLKTFMLGNEYYRNRQFEQAIDSYKRALALKSDYDLVVINMASTAYRPIRSIGRTNSAGCGTRNHSRAIACSWM